MVCITTDNGANIVKAASLNNWTRLQCFGHRLHLAIGITRLGLWQQANTVNNDMFKWFTDNRQGKTILCL